MNNSIRNLFLTALTLLPSAIHAQTIDLSGRWTVAMGNDRHDVTLPGSLLTNNLGEAPSLDTRWTGSLYDSSYYHNPVMAPYRKPGNIKFPFFLTPNRHYVGHAVYTRTVSIPKNWKKRPVILTLERPHIETTVRINGREVGHFMSLSVPHEYDITSFVKFGADNEISIDVYNGIENVCVGQDSHSVTDQTQGNWNGITGSITLRSGNALKVHVATDWTTRTATVRINEKTYKVVIPDARQWDEFHPHLYHRTLDYQGQKVPVTIAFRDITIQGRQFLLNGKPIFLRGTVENCNFPLTGYPPTDVASWLRIIRICKDYGLNAMRFHSYCPPEAAFVAADSLGFYLQPEGPSWPNHGVRLRRHQYIDTYLMDETRRICDAYGNHPSFVMMAAGNEPAGDWVTWCNQWVDSMKVYDNRRVYCGASVGGGWAWDGNSQYHVKGGARGLDWDRRAPQSSDDYFDQVIHPRNFKPTAAVPENTQPYVSHEQGQWCAFPDLDERSQYTGVYKAYNFDIFADLLANNGMASRARDFFRASTRLQWLAYKYETERNLRTRDYAGFQYLGLNDYSGQGTALVGPLNVFWREKGYGRIPTEQEHQEQAAQWRQFCSPVVPLAEFPKFVFGTDEDIRIPLQLYNASGHELTHGHVSWRLVNAGGEVLDHGVLVDDRTLPEGKNIPMGELKFTAHRLGGPAKYRLIVDVAQGGTNSWEFWVYPQGRRDIKYQDIYVSDSLDEGAVKALRRGGKVVLLSAGKVKFGSDVKQSYLPVFWNTSWFKMRPPHTTGVAIDSLHPMFREFPTDSWANLNWWELVNKTQVMNLSEFPQSYQSPVQPIDTWHVSRKLGMVVEVQTGGGSLLMTTMDLSRDLDRRLVAHQLRQSLFDYVSSREFHPQTTVDLQVIRDLFEKEAPRVDMFTKDSPDELKPKIK